MENTKIKTDRVEAYASNPPETRIKVTDTSGMSVEVSEYRVPDGTRVGDFVMVFSPGGGGRQERMGTDIALLAALARYYQGGDNVDQDVVDIIAGNKSTVLSLADAFGDEVGMGAHAYCESNDLY